MANIYTIELDGEIIELESDTEPTAEVVRAALGTSAPITADSSAGEVALTALGNVIPDAKNLVKGAASMLTPSGAVQAMEGMIDLGSSGVSKLVDELGLAKYANPQQMEKYRKYRSVIADEFNELATEGGIKKRLAEKPVTSLLDLSVLGRGISLPLKAQQYSSGLQKAGEIGSKISGAIDPTQIITKPAGMAFDKIKNAADIKRAQMADVDAKIANFTEEGFVIPPSAVESTGTIKKVTESLLGGGTKGKAVKINQKIFNKKARKFVGEDKDGKLIMDIPETTPLTKLVDFVTDQYKGTYDTIKSYKPVVLKKSKTTKGKPEEIDTGFLDASGKPIMKTVTPPPSKTKTIYSRSGKEILKDIKKIKLEYANAWRAARKKAERDGQPIDYKKIEKEKARLDKAETELEVVAKKYGDTKIIDSLKEAKQSYARAFNVESSVKKGNLDATDFYKKNTRNKAPVDGEGKKIMDFVEEYGDVVKPPSKNVLQNFLNLAGTGGKYTAAGATGGIGGLGALFSAERGIPNLLLGKKSQRALSSGNYMPTGSGLLQSASSRRGVGAATFIPSLLETTKAEYAPYSYSEDPSIPTITIRGGGAR
tara:strand:- start:42 stop:1829 length:1788 start_codon:yes stop_codon:yes gene_type:complete